MWRLTKTLRQDHGDGCSYASPAEDLTSFGNTFNAEGGGVYALEWDGDEIKMWHFARRQVPGDIVDRNHVTPNPKAWGPPHAVFGGAGEAGAAGEVPHSVMVC